MSVALITNTTYTFNERRTSNWSSTQEKSISTAYPFDLIPSGPEDYVARTYLQFLWLPNSVMPLTHLIPSLQRISPSSPGTDPIPHPIHTLLDPLLLTPHLVSKKYHTELSQILTNGGGAGEMEETMMWYVVEHEKPVEDDGQLGTPRKKNKHGGEGDDDDGPWTNEAWREKYLERMERREVQIQILLYLFKLSLPGPQPPLPTTSEPESSKPKSRKRKRTRSDDVGDILESERVDTSEDRLEAFMDKLAMWQLVSRIDDALNPSNPTKNTKDERDWIQIFTEDIVEPQFKSKLPDACKLLRSKVFPTSPFSDSESESNPPANPSRKDSPDNEPATSTSTSTTTTTTYIPTGAPLKRSLSRAGSTSFTRSTASLSPYPSPTRITTSTNNNASSSSSRSLIRSRSRSLSLSLAQEREERAAAAAAAAEEQTKKKGRLNREVSMSRVFKKNNKNKDGDNKMGGGSLKIEAPKIVERPRVDMGVTLVEETPVRPRIASTDFGGAGAGGQPIAPLVFGVAKLLPDGSKLLPSVNEDEDEEWMVSSSPNIVMFDPSLEKKNGGKRKSGSGGGGGEQEEGEEWNKDCDPDVERVVKTRKVEVEVSPSQPRRTRKPLKKKTKR